MTAPTSSSTTKKKTKEDLRLCRIVDSTNKKQNGLVGYAPYFGKLAHNSTCRNLVQVQVEGHPTKISIRYSNLVFLPTDVPTLEAHIAVDRKIGQRGKGSTVTAFVASGERFLQQDLPSRSCERSLGNLLAVQAHLAAHSKRNQGKRSKTGILLLCTDLNVSIAINRVASGQTDTTVGATASQQQLWEESIKPQILAFKKLPRQRRNIFAVYRPPRLVPDRNGKARFQAVLAGCFKIYPCAHAHAMEVRYVARNSKSQVVVKHESYLEYGPEEATAYVWNALALGDVHRLVPSTLAKVDPPAFWSAVLHMEKVRDVLHAGDHVELCEEWNRVYAGVQTSQVRWHLEASALLMGGGEEQWPSDVLQGTNTTDWGIDNNPAQHERIAYGCAHTALLVLLEAASFFGQQGNLARNPVQVELMECYQNLEIGRLVSALNALYRMEQHHVSKLGVLEEADHACFLKHALEEAGYYASTSSCSEEEESNPIAALTQLAVRRLVQSKGIQLSSQPEKTVVVRRPTQPSPDTGVGSISLVTLPNHEGYLLSASDGGTTIKFRHPLDLDPVTRFCLACGPLQDLALAQSCLDQAMEAVGQDLTQLTLHRYHIRLTPLEWAAKSGNTIIAHWLCNHPRTKHLVHLGCPVGWACHAGNLQILRKLVHAGADPSKTGPSLAHLPPLLVAAERGHQRPMKFLVGQCGVDIQTQGPQGLGILESIEQKAPKNWEQLANYKDAHAWARLRIVNGFGRSTIACNKQGLVMM